MKSKNIEMSVSTAKNLMIFLRKILENNEYCSYWTEDEPLFYFKKDLNNKIELIDKLESIVDEVNNEVDSDIKLSNGWKTSVGMCKPKLRLEELEKIEPFINMVNRKLKEVS